MTVRCLNPEWELIVRDNKAFIVRLQDNVLVSALFAHEALVVALMDGYRTNAMIRELMIDIAGSQGKRALEQVMARLKPLLTDQYQRSLTLPLEQLASVSEPARDNPLKHLPGPRVLHWWVTDICPRRCVYCFANPILGSKALDATISRESLKNIFMEASSLGAEMLLVAGGEPFLREDLPEVLGDAIALGIEPGLTTKFPVSVSLAERLKTAGLKHICLSVDSFIADENLKILGSKSYGEQVRQSVENLIHVGIQFSFEIVLTQLNYLTLHKVIAECAKLQAVVVQVVPYEPVLNVIADYDNKDLLLPEHYNLDRDIDQLQSRYPAIDIQKFVQLGSEASTHSCQCDIGISKLLFSPDGSVHRCYKLLNDKRLTGENLSKVSVAEVWHSHRYSRQVQPAKEVYKNSQCFSCAKFSSCNEDGRCIFQSYLKHDTYYSADRECGGPF
ncbi:hypothetical protein MNBD_GAMMA12-2978 [hydrothermal vent metagenome]|uniref:Radical SAM core domain-containing protein n=1 Tax=hydrothermal vent metagenome TaxID=652676 RepID=A0A3B0XUH4_9ZZZZ